MVIRRAGDPPRPPPTTPRAARASRARAAERALPSVAPDAVDRLEAPLSGAPVEHTPATDAHADAPPRPDLAQLRVSEALERAQRRCAAEVVILLDASASAERRRRAWRALERARHALRSMRARAARAERAASADARGISAPDDVAAQAALEASLAAAIEAHADAPPRRRARAALALALDHGAPLGAGARDAVVSDLAAALAAEPARDVRPTIASPALVRLAALLGVAPLPAPPAARAPAADDEAAP
jgi:hypothetical protein